MYAINNKTFCQKTIRFVKFACQGKNSSKLKRGPKTKIELSSFDIKDEKLGHFENYQKSKMIQEYMLYFLIFGGFIWYLVSNLLKIGDLKNNSFNISR